MCNYEMLVRIPAACSQTQIDQLQAAIRSIVSFSSSSSFTVCSTNKVVVDTGAKDGRSNADVRASHLHRGLPISRHTHAQLQRAQLRVLLQEISTQIVQLLEIGFRRRVQLPDRHKSHQMQLRAVAQNELCQRKALFREATTLSRRAPFFFFSHLERGVASLKRAFRLQSCS